MVGRMIFAVSLLTITAAVVSAQTPQVASGPGTAVSVRGCVAPVQRDGSLALKAGTAATPNTAADEANSTEPTGRFILLDALQIAPATTAPDTGRRSFALFGHEPDLAKQNGHRVEIVGSVVPTVAGTGKGAAVDGIQHIRVGSLKRIAGNCSARPKSSIPNP